MEKNQAPYKFRPRFPGWRLNRFPELSLNLKGKCSSGRSTGNEQGSVLILALILMSVISILAVTSVTMTSTEFKIVRNERIYQDNFYRAESAARQGIQTLEEASTSDLEDRSFQTLAWLSQEDDNADMSDTSLWDSSNSASASISNADYAVVETGISQGSSLDMTATSNLYKYVSYGHGHSGNGGTSVIEIGYKMRH